MSRTDIPYNDAGMAEIQFEQFTATELFADNFPDIWTSNELADATLIAAQDLKLGTVVGRNGAGNIVLAQTSGTPIIPIGITAAWVKMGSTVLNVPIFRAGSFNIDKLTWHTDYSTDTLKLRAFEAGYAGAAFNLKKFYYAGVYPGLVPGA